LEISLGAAGRHGTSLSSPKDRFGSICLSARSSAGQSKPNIFSKLNKVCVENRFYQTVYSMSIETLGAHVAELQDPGAARKLE
jgi:hypothetical protein